LGVIYVTQWPIQDLVDLASVQRIWDPCWSMWQHTWIHVCRSEQRRNTPLFLRSIQFTAMINLCWCYMPHFMVLFRQLVTFRNGLDV